MRLILGYWLLIILSSTGWAQHRLSLSGKIIDEESGEALIFASIGIRGHAIGTITNSQGEFDFHFPASLKDQSLQVSMLGYVNYVATISQLIGQESLEIRMKRAFIPLEDVVVEDVISGPEIARLALFHIETNFPNAPFYSEGFYRDVKKLGGRYFSMLEAAVKIQDLDYKKPRNPMRLQERVGVIEVRRSLGYNTRFTKYFDNANLLEDLLLHNAVRYRNFPEGEKFAGPFKRQSDTEINDRSVYVIAREGEANWRLFIDKQSFAIIRMEHQSTAAQPLEKKKNLVYRKAYINLAIDFQEHGGKMYLHFIRMTTKTHWFDRRTMEFKFETELLQELAINKIQPETFIRISSQERMKRYGLQYQDNPYNKAFWENYNMLKENPLHKKIIEDLERDGALEKQFEN
jgi:hypothetical protein